MSPRMASRMASERRAGILPELRGRAANLAWMNETLLAIVVGAVLTLVVQEIRAARENARQVDREEREHERAKGRQQEERIRLRNEQRLEDTQRAFYAQVDYLVAFAVAKEPVFDEVLSRAHGHLHPQHDFELVGSDDAALKFVEFVERTLSRGRLGGDVAAIYQEAQAVNSVVLDALNRQTERVLRDQPIDTLSPDVAKRLSEAMAALQGPA